MLATMMAYCPSSMEQSIMFQDMFLPRMPVTLRTLLGEQEPWDISSLAARADKLWAMHLQAAWQSQGLGGQRGHG
jgi:hypothetical protein